MKINLGGNKMKNLKKIASVGLISALMLGMVACQGKDEKATNNAANAEKNAIEEQAEANKANVEANAEEEKEEVNNAAETEKEEEATNNAAAENTTEETAK